MVNLEEIVNQIKKMKKADDNLREFDRKCRKSYEDNDKETLDKLGKYWKEFLDELNKLYEMVDS